MLFPLRFVVFAIVAHTVFVCAAAEELSLDYGGRWNSRVVAERFRGGEDPPNVSKIFSDHEGLIWTAGSAGIHVFNGGGSYSVAMPEAAAGKPVIALLEYEENDEIRFLTADGVGLISRSGGVRDFYEINSFGCLHDFTQLSDGSLAITSDKGIVSVAFDERGSTRSSILYASDSVRDILPDRSDSNVLWVCDVQRGIVKFSIQEETVQLFSMDGESPGAFALCQDKNGAVFAGGRNQLGVIREGELSCWPFSIPQGNGRISFSNLTYDPINDRIWIGTDREQGLLSFDPRGERLVHYGHTIVLRKAKKRLELNDLCVDSSGVLWLATNDEGLIRTNTATMPWVVRRNSGRNQTGTLSSGNVVSVHGNRERIQIHSTGGISRIDRESGELSNFEPNGNDHLLAVSEPGDEATYGVFPNGLRKLNSASEGQIAWGELYPFPFSRKLKTAKCVLVSRESSAAWVVADFMILYFDGKRFKRVGGPSLPYVASRAIVIDRSLWVSAKDHLFEVSEEALVMNHHPLEAGIDSLDMVVNRAKSKLWIGFSSGIYRFDLETKKGEVAIDVEDGVQSICSAEKGRLWFLSATRLKCFDPRIRSVIPYPLESQLSEAFDQASMVRSTNYGEISVAGTGVTLLTIKERDLFNQGRHMAPLLFTGFELLDRNPETLREKSEAGFDIDAIAIPADASGIRLKFAIPDFRTPGANRVEYRFADEDWRLAPGGAIELTEMNRADGKLLVRGFNSAGMPTANDLSIKLKSMPFFWEKPSFYVGSVLVLFLLLGGLYSWRTGVIIKANEKLVASNKALAESESCYRRIFDHSTDAMFVTDGDCKILNFNPSARKLMSKLTDESPEMADSVCQFAADADAFCFLMKRAGKGEVIENEPAQFLDEQSKPVEVLVSIVKVDEEGSQWQFQIRDISRQCEMETQIRQAQKMEAVGTLAGGIAHDFNNLLSPIAIHSQLAKSSLEENGADAIAEAIDAFETCEEASRKAADLVKGLLHFAKKSDEGCRVGDLVPMVQEATRLLRGSVASNVSFDVDLPDMVVPVYCSEQRLEQALMNLVVNAGHAIGNATGNISIGLRRATVEDPILPELLPFDGWALSVTDSGKGMDEETLSKVFDPFFTTKGNDGGTGLGLATVHSFAGECGGFVHVSSEVGKGTCFQLFLPEAKEEIVEAGKESPVRGRFDFETEADKESLRVMVVDDSRAVLFASTKMLEKFGHQVTAFCNPEEALQFYTSNFRDVDVVVSDQMMPEMTGLDLARGIHDITPEMKVVLLTGFSQIDLEGDDVSRDIAKVHMKPLDYSDLNETLCLLTGDGLASSVALSS